MIRRKLPDRRPDDVIDMGRYSLSVGFYPDTGEIGEVFASSPHRGTEYEHIITDACTIISIAMQYGVPVSALCRSVGRIPAYRLGKLTEIAASPLGEILDKIDEIGTET